MITNKLVRVLIASIIMFQNSCSNATESPEAKITIKVVGEDGSSLEGVDVGATFEVSKGTSPGIKYNTERGITDKDGIYVVSGKTMFNVPYGATKQGYYKSNGEYSLVSNKNGRWQPWNPELTVLLRKIDNPIPMYARDTHKSPIAIPDTGKVIGFDLIEYDWLSPYGKGKHADFVFQMSGKFNNKDDYDNKLVITFSNKFDGIQLFKEDRKFGSQLKLPKTAPDAGYQNKLIRSRTRVPGNPIIDDFKEDNNYIFRIRSEEKNGKIIRAMYGKINGDITFYPKSTNRASIVFKYYLNPDFSKNLEFNSDKNLFNNLPSTEEVGLD